MGTLHQIVSVAPDGLVTRHWQLADLATAERMAAALALRIGDREKVKLRHVVEVIQRQTFESEMDFGAQPLA